MFSLEELNVLRTGLDLVTIQGKSAKQMVNLQIKVEKQITKKMKEIESPPAK